MHAINDAILISVETNACGDTAGDENYTTLMHISTWSSVMLYWWTQFDAEGYGCAHSRHITASL